jgi:hypothetical protein
MWGSTVAVLILVTFAIERVCPEAPYGFLVAIWGLLLTIPTAQVLASRYGADPSGTDAEAPLTDASRGSKLPRSARGGNPGGRTLLAVWMAAAGAVLVAAGLTEWQCPDAPSGYEMALWLLFVFTPLVYTILAWYEAGVGRGCHGGGRVITTELAVGLVLTALACRAAGGRGAVPARSAAGSHHREAEARAACGDGST